MSPNLFDTLLEPTVIVDKNGIITYINETGSQLLDSTPRKIIRLGTNFFESFIFVQNIPWKNTLDSLSESTPYIESEFKTQSNKSGKAQITVQPFSVGNENTDPSFIIFFRDVTLEERLQLKYRAELEQKESVIDDLKIARNKLEDYSKNLETIVEQRTSEINKLNRLMKTLIDSLNQSFIVFSRDGLCSHLFSKSSITHFAQSPQDKSLAELLGISNAKTKNFEMWLNTMFDEMLPFDDLKVLGPQTFSCNAQVISLDYFPMRNDSGQIENIAIVGTNITDLLEAQKQSAIEREHAQSILKMIQSKNELITFLNETQVQIIQLKGIHPINQKLKDEALRILHTIKGGAATFSYIELRDHVHQMEGQLGQYSFENNPTGFENENLLQKIEHEYKKIIEFIHVVFGSNVFKTQDVVVTPIDIFEHWLSIKDMMSLKAEMNDFFSNTEVRHFCRHFEPTVRAAAESLNKKVKPIEFIGDNLRISKKRFQALFQSFVHLLRNSIDHGIETEDVRLAQGKDAEGKIQVRFEVHQNGLGNDQLYISFKDDGQGIDPNRVRKKLEDKKILHEHLSNQEVTYFIFRPEFSTRDDVTLYSGRGVGLDAVKHEIDQLGGDIEILNSPQNYCEFLFKIPLNSNSKSMAA